MKFLQALIIIQLCIIYNGAAQTQRALVIGIDKYMPPAGIIIPKENGRIEFNDLDGCRNDAMAMKSLLGAKFGFPEKNIAELYDERASRDNILHAMQSLLNDCKKGDIAFIYYAGHGSQQKNSKSREADKKDESIVPSNTWEKGVEDIRDKEFAKICNSFLDKGVKLTVIIDCCHSGSMSRGMVYDKPKYRYIAENNYDANDASNPSPPEERKGAGFLIMSAAQDNEFAEEQTDNNNIVHGAFTLALMTALNQQSVDASAANLFNGARAILKSNGKMQEPVLGAAPERQKQTLFGMAKGALPDKILIPVASVKNNKVELQGGYAESLYRENELTLVNNDSVVLRIDTVVSINKSIATVIKGSIGSIRPGMVFEVTNWVSSRALLLKLYIPPSPFSYEQVLKFAALDLQLKNSAKVQWINDLEKKDPYVTAYFNGDKFYFNTESEGISEHNDYTLVSILQEAKEKPLFFNVPPADQLVSAIREELSHTPNIKIVLSAADAHYVLYGTIGHDGRPCYGLLRAQSAARDSLESMPVQTKKFILQANSAEAYEKLADSIREYALRLSKVRGWLNLAGPRGSQFPFHVELVNDKTQQVMDTFTYKINDHISFHLVANKTNEGFYIPQKYVYVFAIDRNGEMILGYPNANAGNVENKFPTYTNGSIVKDVTLFGYTVTEPVGTDNFYLIACDEPIEDYAMVFNQPGVRSLETRGQNNPLVSLLNMGNDNAAWNIKSAPAWKLIHVAVKTTH